MRAPLTRCGGGLAFGVNHDAVVLGLGADVQWVAIGGNVKDHLSVTQRGATDAQSDGYIPLVTLEDREVKPPGCALRTTERDRPTAIDMALDPKVPNVLRHCPVPSLCSVCQTSLHVCQIPDSDYTVRRMRVLCAVTMIRRGVRMIAGLLGRMVCVVMIGAPLVCACYCPAIRRPRQIMPPPIVRPL
jgi:hypothetical protein